MSRGHHIHHLDDAANRTFKSRFRASCAKLLVYFLEVAHARGSREVDFGATRPKTTLPILVREAVTCWLAATFPRVWSQMLVPHEVLTQILADSEADHAASVFRAEHHRLDERGSGRRDVRPQRARGTNMRPSGTRAWTAASGMALRTTSAPPLLEHVCHSQLSRVAALRSVCGALRRCEDDSPVYTGQSSKLRRNLCFPVCVALLHWCDSAHLSSPHHVTCHRPLISKPLHQ